MPFDPANKHPNFSSTHQPAGKRQRVSERHFETITLAQDLMAGSLIEIAKAAVDIAKGNAVEHVIDHKNGTIHEIPVQPATRLKAQQFVFERIAGKPESTKTHELGEQAAGIFKVLLGKPAEDHWAGAIEAPVAPALPAEVE